MEAISIYLRENDEKLSDPKWQPHPIIKAMMLALHAAREGKKDGNYIGISGDAELHHGVPHLSYAVVMQKLGGKYNILEVSDVTTGQALTPGTIQRIIDADTELEKFAGNSVPIDVAVIIMNRAIPEINVVKLDDHDRNATIDYAKKMINEKKLQGVPPNTVKQILGVKNDQDWVNLPSEVRSVIGMAWAMKIGKRTVVITHVEESIPKWKVREFITFTLYKTELPSAQTKSRA
jgi:uncharacterized protein with FMN-binding domain